MTEKLIEILKQHHVEFRPDARTIIITDSDRPVSYGDVVLYLDENGAIINMHIPGMLSIRAWMREHASLRREIDSRLAQALSQLLTDEFYKPDTMIDPETGMPACKNILLSTGACVVLPIHPVSLSDAPDRRLHIIAPTSTLHIQWPNPEPDARPAYVELTETRVQYPPHDVPGHPKGPFVKALEHYTLPCANDFITGSLANALAACVTHIANR